MTRINTYTLTELCEVADVSPNTVYQHTDRGAIPRPTATSGRRLLYTDDEKKLIVNYFMGREKHTRIEVYA